MIFYPGIKYSFYCLVTLNIANLVGQNRHVFELVRHKKVQVGKDQEKAQSEKDSHSKNQGGKKPN